MGYRAYHQVTQTIKRGQGHDDLIMEGNDYADVQNTFYLCSAYEPDKIEGPWDVLQQYVVSSFTCYDRGGNFTWADDDIKEILAEIKEQFPDHKETNEVIKALKEIQKRDRNSGSYDFICY